MATDQERLLVVIEARLRQFERAMQQATGGADRAARRIETRFRTMDSRLSGIGAGFGRSLLAAFAGIASARGLAEATDAFIRIENALKIVGLEGEEAAAVFDKLFESAQRFGAPMEALVEVFRAGSLAQKELNVTSEELLNFTNGIAAALRVSGKSAGESRGAMIQLAQAIGSGVVRAEEFNAILEGALPIAQAAARGLEEAGGSVARLRKLIIDGKVSSEAFFRAFEAGQSVLQDLATTTDFTLGQAMTRLDNSFISLIGQLNEATGASKFLTDALGDVAGALNFLGQKINELPDLSEKIGAIFSTLGNIPGLSGIGALRQVTSDLAAMGEVADVAGNRIKQAFGAAEGQRTVSLNNFAVPETRGGGGGGRGGGRSPAQQFEEDIARIRERTEALRAEAEVIGESTFVQEKAAAVIDLTNEARRAGVQITAEVVARIDQEAAAYARAAETLEELEEAHRRVQEISQFVGQGILDSFFAVVEKSKTAKEAVADLIKELVKAAVYAKFLNVGPFASGTGGGLLGNLLGGFLGGTRAGGGPVSPGRAYVVGEKGPELLVPAAAGRIIPNGGAQQVETHVRVDPSPFFVTTVESRVMQGQRQTLSQVPRIMADMQRRVA